MEDNFSINIIFSIDGMSCEHCVKTLSKALQVEAIKDLKIEVGEVSLKFDPSIISMTSIKYLIEGAGYSIANLKKKGFIGRFIDSLAESNKKEFGSKRLDCCDLKKR